MSVAAKDTWAAKVGRVLPRPRVSDAFVHKYTNLMFIISLCGTLPLLFRCYRVHCTKKAEEICLYTTGFQIFASCLWIFYGTLIGNGGIVVSSIIIIVATITLLFLCKRCKGKKGKC